MHAAPTKYLPFIDFKKAVDRVWHAALWATMRKYNIGVNRVRGIEHLYDKATSAVLVNGRLGGMVLYHHWSQPGLFSLTHSI